MRKKEGKKFILSVTFFEISLFILSSFAFIFLISQASLVSSIGDDPTGSEAQERDFKTGAGGESKRSQTPVAASSISAGKYGNGKEIYSVTGRSETFKTLVIGKDGKAIATTADGKTISDLSPEEVSALQGKMSSNPKSSGINGNDLTEIAVWAGTAYVIYSAGPGFLEGLGVSKGNSKALSYALAAGVATYGTIQQAEKFGFIDKENQIYKQRGLITLGVMVAVYLLTYKEEKQQAISFECTPYEPPLGGQKCEQCNKNPLLKCSEYRCKSLGQACGLLNPGTDHETCAWIDQRDVTSPVISPWKEAISLGHKYAGVNANGFKVEQENQKCVKPFSLIEFGINTNEPSQCKVDYSHTNKYDDMKFYVGDDSLYTYNHSQTISLPGLNNEENGTLSLTEKEKTLNLYVRCRDGNNNTNVQEYAISLCVDDSPDTTPPIIDSTSIPTNSPITFGTDNVSVAVYVNEPSDCSWSRFDKAYEDMENKMVCFTTPVRVNSNILYTCTDKLTGIKNSAENNFFFRCKDNPGKANKDRNVNSQSYKLTLRGSKALNIDDVNPNGTIFSSTSVATVNIEALTSNGADEGKATCYFSSNGNAGSYIAMYESNSHKHKQTIDLGEGNYRYFIRCIDAAGNSDEANTTFNVFVDRSAPIVTRIYKADDLKVITNENAECAYSLTTCNFNFNEGIKMIYSDPSVKTIHFAEWKNNAIYNIKCKDVYGNEPSPNQCSIIASATDLSAGQSQ